MKRIFVYTFGCQMNEYDSQRLVRMLYGKGFSLADKPKEADVVFINTCSVRIKAEQKLYSLLGRLKGIKDRNPNLVIVVGGCVAEQLKEKLLERFPYVDLVIGTRAIPSVPELIEKALGGSKGCAFFPEEEEKVCGVDWLRDTSRYWEPGVVEFVTIMQGCDNFCSYCIVPYVRGRERSRSPDDIIEEIKILNEKGAKEIVLLGQNVNSYGKGLEQKINFSGLIERIAKETKILRLRFTTSHPKDLTEDLMIAFRDISILCPHLHLPFQAGSDRILKLMNRGYTQKDYLRKIELLRKYRPDIAVTADVMVGFPTESEEDFLETMKVVEEVQFDGLFSFKYSDRPFTASSKMEPKVDEEAKTSRLTRLQEFQKQVTLRKNREEEGKIREVLVEGKSKAGGNQLTGRTPQNRIVNFTAPSELIGKIVAVKIVEGYANSLRGELIEVLNY